MEPSYDSSSNIALGTKVSALTPLTRASVDCERLGRELVHAYLRQIIVDGCFHADPHPGNVFLTDVDGWR